MMKYFLFNLAVSTMLIASCNTPLILPVIPTATPGSISSSDVPKLAITETPGLKSTCPAENPVLVPNIELPQDAVYPINLKQPILDFLNTGGSREALISFLARAEAVREENLVEKDLTGDGIPELIVGESYLRIYTCRDEQYYVVADLEPWTRLSPTPVYIGDMNQNGLPEIVVDRLNDGVVDIDHSYKILEWNGQEFENLISPQDFQNRYIRASSIMEGWIEIGGVSRPLGSRQWVVEDTDKNGTLELILLGGISVNNEGYYMGPWRVTTTIYMWDGNNFVMHAAAYEPAEFRFQAVQDADYAMITGQYEDAFRLYQDVISSDTLAWWSEEMRGYVTARVADSDIIPTLTLPAPDLKERDNLTAYAFYRVLLLHALRGNVSDAQANYDTLQNQYPVNHEGHAYAELARVFWTTFQTSRTIGTACDTATKFADEHRQEILYYIGSNTRHGWQSLYYEPEDICPSK